MSHCAVYGCNNNSRKTSGIIFHRFPKEETLCKLWINACSRDDEINVKNARICSEHFDVQSYRRDLSKEEFTPVTTERRRNLKQDAVPTLKLPIIKEFIEIKDIGSINVANVNLPSTSTSEPTFDSGQFEAEFPRDSKLRKLWISKCRRKDPFNPDTSRVCSAHFKPEEFKRNLQAELLGSRPKASLKPNVIPTLNLKRKNTKLAATTRKRQMQEKNKKEVCFIATALPLENPAPLSVCTKIEQHSVIRFLWSEGESGAAIHQRLSAQYGNSVLSQQSVYEWIEKFNNGCTDVTNDEAEQLSTATNKNNTVRTPDMVLLDRRNTSEDSYSYHYCDEEENYESKNIGIAIKIEPGLTDDIYQDDESKDDANDFLTGCVRLKEEPYSDSTSHEEHLDSMVDVDNTIYIKQEDESCMDSSNPGIKIKVALGRATYNWPREKPSRLKSKPATLKVWPWDLLMVEPDISDSDASHGSIT